jgi:hypothetical protein
VYRQHPANASESGADKGKKATKVGLPTHMTLRWAESLEYLPNAAAFPYEGVPENFQFLAETILVTDDYGSVYHGGKHSLLFHWMAV